VAVIGRSRSLRVRAHGVSARAGSPDAELRRARRIVLAGIALWVSLALLVVLRYGAIATFVLVGWGVSIVLCSVFMFGPRSEQRVGRRMRSTDATPAIDTLPPAVDPVPEVIDLRDDVLRSAAIGDVAIALESPVAP
jgi:hypothetical protein